MGTKLLYRASEHGRHFCDLPKPGWWRRGLCEDGNIIECMECDRKWIWRDARDARDSGWRIYDGKIPPGPRPVPSPPKWERQ